MFIQLRTARLCLVVALAALAVALAGSQSAHALSVPVLIDSVTVGDAVVVVTGAVDSDLLEVNGQAIVVGDDGSFRAEVDLPANALVFRVLDSQTETVTIRIPIDVLLATGGKGVLDDLHGAGISIDVPDEGFKIVDGQMPLIEGRVSNDSNLSSLEVNGQDVLHTLGPSGLFSVAPGSSTSTSRETVTVVATDRSGVSQKSTFTTTKVTSTIATRAGTSVSAAGARGILIAKVAFDKRLLKPAKYLRLVVTVKDLRGYRIRGASLRLRAMPSKHVRNSAIRAAFTNRIGRAAFGYRLNANAFTGQPGKVLTFVMRAATPTSSVNKSVTLRLSSAVTG
jgi:hypothetical protein